METPSPTPPTDKRELLATLMRSGAAPVPLSHGQQSLWFLDRMRPEASVAYNMPFAWTVPAGTDLAALRRAFGWLTERHPILRTTYSHVRGTPVQRAHPTMGLDFRVTDVDGPQALGALLDTECRRRFDIERGPVHRAVLARRPDGPTVLLWVVHHLAIDGWSLFQLLDELGAAYTAFRAGKTPDSAPPAATYAQFVAWQAAMLAGPDGQRLEEFWRRQLTGAPTLELPTDRPRPVTKTFHGAAHAFRLEGRLSAAVRDLVAESGTTLYTVLLAAFQTVLCRAADQTDIPLGTWTAGRSRPEFSEVAGYFVNPVVLRTDLSGDPAFADVLDRAHRVVLDALEHQDYPFPLLVEKLGAERDPGRSPLFDVAFTLRASQRGEFIRSESREAVSPLGATSAGERGMLLRVGDLALSSFPLDQRTVRFDLEAEFIEADGEVSGLFRYNTDLYDPATMDWLSRCLLRVLREATADPRRRIGALDWLPRPPGRAALAQMAPASPGASAGDGAEAGAAREGAEAGAAGDGAALLDTIREIWGTVLGLAPEEIEPHADFFSVGGHSLAAVRVAMEIQERLDTEVTIADIFQYLTPAALAERLGAATDDAPRPVPRVPGAGYPLSYVQEGVWVQQQMVPDGLGYSAPHTFRLTGPLDVGALEGAIGAIIARHESLRTTFRAGPRGPEQRITAPEPFALPVTETQDALPLVEEEFRRPFDLAAGPPLRVRLYRTGPDRHVLLVLVHHIVFDGWSAALFWRELCDGYRSRTGPAAPGTDAQEGVGGDGALNGAANGAANGTADGAPAGTADGSTADGGTADGLAPEIQNADCAVWERSSLTGDRLAGLVSYWRAQLAGGGERSFPTDFPRPRLPVLRGERHTFTLPGAGQALCRATGATPHMVQLAVFQAWLAQHTGHPDTVTGTVASGRSRAETAGVIGHFVNLLPVRTDLTGARTFTDVVARVRGSLLGAYEHQELPLPLLVAELGLGRRRPFDVVFDYRDGELLRAERRALPGIVHERLEPPGGVAQFDLFLELTDTGDEVRAVLEYDTALFRPETVAAMAADLQSTAERLLSGPDKPLER